MLVKMFQIGIILPVLLRPAFALDAEQKLQRPTEMKRLSPCTLNVGSKGETIGPAPQQADIELRLINTLFHILVSIEPCPEFSRSISADALNSRKNGEIKLRENPLVPEEKITLISIL